MSSLAETRELREYFDNTDDEALRGLHEYFTKLSEIGVDLITDSEGLRDNIYKKLRAHKVSQSATEVLLREAQANAHPTRDFLEELWQFLQEKKVELPINLTTRYLALKEGKHPIESAPRAAAPSHQLGESIKAETKQDQSDDPKLVMGPREMVVGETPSVRLHTPGSATPTGSGLMKFISAKSRNNHADDSDSDAQSVDLQGWTSNIWAKPAVKRRNSGKVKFGVKRPKMEQDSTESVLQASRHTQPSIKTETGKSGPENFVRVKHEE